MNKEELKVWCDSFGIPYSKISFFKVIIPNKEYRSVLYFRLGFISKLVSWYSPGVQNLNFSIASCKIKKGLVIRHGHSTEIFPDRVGINCKIWHNVTIGRSLDGGARPLIGDNVSICAGAIVIGEIVIGNNVVVGAGAVVVKNVPDNCVVVGNPAYIVKKDGVKVNIKL